MILIFFITLVYVMWIFTREYYESVDIKAIFINVAISNLSNHYVIYENDNIDITKDYRIFEIDINKLFPENSLDNSFSISNFFVEKQEIIQSKIFYIVVQNGRKHSNKFMKVNIDYKYKLDKNEFSFRQTLYFEFTYIRGELICKNIQFGNRRRKWGFKNKVKYFDVVIDKNLLLLNNYVLVTKKGEYINTQKDWRYIQELFKNNNYTKQKFLINDNPFGTGKSTIDLFCVANNNYNPIVISPWEDNTEYNFLYLTFIKLKEQVNKRFFIRLAWDTKIIFIGTLFAVISATVLIMNFLLASKGLTDFFLNLRNTVNQYDVVLKLFNRGGILLIVTIIYLLLYPTIVTNLIIYKKNFDTYYKDFLLREIVSMLSDNKNILIIEDIDRLDTEERKRVVRDIASINDKIGKMDSSKHIVGIISVDMERLKKQEEEEEFKNVSDKIAYTNIHTDYDPKKSVKKYLNHCVNNLEVNNFDISNRDKTDIKKIRNFREARKMIIYLLEKYEKKNN